MKDRILAAVYSEEDAELLSSEIDKRRYKVTPKG